MAVASRIDALPMDTEQGLCLLAFFEFLLADYRFLHHSLDEKSWHHSSLLPLLYSGRYLLERATDR